MTTNGISSAASSVLSSTTLQQTQQQVEHTKQQQAQEVESQDIAAVTDSSANDLDLSISYEVKLSQQANEAYTQPQPTMAKGDGSVPAASDTASNDTDTSSTTQSSSSAATEATTTTTSSSDSSTDLTSKTEQQMRSMVSEGTITRAQMLDELARRSGEAGQDTDSVSS